MVCRIGGPVLSLVVVGALTAADAAAQEAAPAANRQTGSDSAEPAAERSSLGQAMGMIMLDYQVIPVPQHKPIDLMGFHVLTGLTDWLYVGVGAYAPLFKGEYGGFMTFDVTVQVQRKIWGDLFADAGVSLGGGGGGKSQEHSVVLTGTGGFAKGYVGLGYDFTDFSIGANVARMKFKQSAIDSTQLNVFLQVPFKYHAGSYSSAGEKLGVDDARRVFDDSSENTLTLGLDNLSQIDPQGSNKSTIRLVDLQFAHYMTRSAYWYASLGVGYGGLRLYNQLIGGLGYRLAVFPSVSLLGQLGLGSGGWSPDRIDTGPGLLVYPKVAAEVAITRNFGLALSAGYLFAPKGSSKNYTYGATLSYHLQSDRDAASAGAAPDGMLYRGYRFSVFPQTEYNVSVRNTGQSNVNLLSGQLDTIVDDHVYIPIQASVATNAYMGRPGYGELLAGVGVQTRYDKDDRFQFFAQLLGGTNAHGPVLKPAIGVNVGLSDRLAVYAAAGKTRAVSSKDINFRSDYVGLGLTYRLSVPSW